MDRNAKTVKVVTDERIAETSSKGNQEKWFDKAENRWYKLDHSGYESLAETLISRLLERSNIESDTPFKFVRYDMVRLNAHGRDRTGCVSDSFLRHGEAVITINRLLSMELGMPLRDKLSLLSSDKKRIVFLAEEVRNVTGLAGFAQYLCLLFEVDALFANDDRHLNNIAVIERDGKYGYCPIFDNGAGLLSNVWLSPMDIAPKALLSALKARPFGTTFNRQMNAARELYGAQLNVPRFTRTELKDALEPLLQYYSQHDRGIITDRVCDCVMIRQRYA